jgi:hypothetical protein
MLVVNRSITPLIDGLTLPKCLILRYDEGGFRDPSGLQALTSWRIRYNFPDATNPETRSGCSYATTPRAMGNISTRRRTQYTSRTRV